MPEAITLTEAERVAREHFLLQFREGSSIPCDTEIKETDLPLWFDEIKYKRGQQYFQDNRLGILNSNLIGLICLLAEPRGLQILAGTGRSSNKETAKKRYLSTVLHTLNWYEFDLTENSKSRKSLNAVRKMHFLASKSSEEKNIGSIKQVELAMTAFGFMGFPLIRPHHLGIRCDNQEDREGFIHVWAIICYMIGVQDKFNICLLPMDALEVLCQMILRYLLIPILQIETPLFREMTQAMLDGMSSFLPNLDYDAQLFKAKMMCGIPGYQYDTDLSKELLCRAILTQKDIDTCNNYFLNTMGQSHIPLTYNIPIIETIKNDSTYTNSNVVHHSFDKDDHLFSMIYQKMELTAADYLNIKYVNYEDEWETLLNDSKFHLLNMKSQSIIKRSSFGRKIYQYSMLRYLIECVISMILNRMKKAQKS